SYFSFSRPTECLADSANLQAAALQRAGSDVRIFLSFFSAPPVLASLQGHGCEKVPKHLRCGRRWEETGEPKGNSHGHREDMQNSTQTVI
ncbi:hypothetical protein PDJAM_G00127380, partial [Pangasius djambal]|nr:hypothetical protein [Pangasius djambal]